LVEAIGLGERKNKSIKEDQDKVPNIIKNQEFITMRAVERAWPAPSTKDEELKELVWGIYPYILIATHGPC
jgi:hypothetical protein